MAFEELDDFEQEEQVKKWIKDNWLNMAVGIGLGLAGVYGINWWKQHQLQKKYALADQFQQFAQVIATDQGSSPGAGQPLPGERPAAKSHR